MDIATGLLLLCIGIFAGGYGIIVGAGGGFIFVPALLLVFNMDPAISAASGLVIVLINALSGIFGYARQKKIDYNIGWMIAIGALPGALIGVWLLQEYSSQYFHIIFATLLVGLGVFLFSKNSPFMNKEKQQQQSFTDTVPTRKQTSIWLIPTGLVMGILSSYLGIGGGWLLVPILIYLFKVTPQTATATSIFTLALYSTIGVISQLFLGNINWMAVIWGGAGVILGAQVGVMLSKRIPGKVIVQMLSVLLIIVGVRMYF